jgi:protein-tyrosine phosphatase
MKYLPPNPPLFPTATSFATSGTRGPWTSASHPIRVDFLPPASHGLPGRLGLTFAPGKCDVRWNRDLDTDLKALQELGATRLISLMEDREYAHLEIPTLRDRARDFGLTVTWHMIPDQGVPQDTGAFRALIESIVLALQAGETVIVHCRGGLGRTGIVAACTLIERGMEAMQALAAVRAARAGTVETRQQEAYLAHYARVRTKAVRAKAPARKRSPKAPKDAR